MRQFLPIDTSRLAMRKLANLPEPPPDSGEVPQEDLGSLHREPVNRNTDIKHPAWHAAKAVGGSALAFGGGMGLGYLANKGVEHVMGHPISSSTVRSVAPVLSGLSSLAYYMYKNKEQEQLRRAIEAHQNKPPRTVPGK
jgi:hypothetical protein